MFGVDSLQKGDRIEEKASVSSVVLPGAKNCLIKHITLGRRGGKKIFRWGFLFKIGVRMKLSSDESCSVSGRASNARTWIIFSTVLLSFDSNWIKTLAKFFEAIWSQVEVLFLTRLQQKVHFLAANELIKKSFKVDSIKTNSGIIMFLFIRRSFQSSKLKHQFSFPGCEC